MTTLIRILHLLNSEDAQTHLTKRQNATQEPLVGGDRAGFIAMGVIALCSFISTLCLLSFLTYRFIFWKRYYKRPLAANQYVVLIYNLLLIDIQQATAFLLCLHWVSRGYVYYPSAVCVLQGWWIQVGDPGSGLFIMAIAMHTGAVVLRGRQLPHRTFVCCVVALWAFIIVLGLIPVGLFGSKTFVISEAGWCWLGPEHETERLWAHYLWIFLAEFGTVVFYGMLFFHLRRRMNQAAVLRQRHQESLKRLNRVVIYMVIYPIVYLVLSLPLAAGRMSTARHIVQSRGYFAVAGSLMALSGLVDVAVYALTRRHLLLDTEISTSDKIYAYSNSNAYQTHITTTTRENKKVRVGSRLRRGLQTLNDTINDGDSTEDLRKGGDMEMADLGHGVYQETTIEISHEPADPVEYHGNQRSSG
ncbi:G protein-coupled glucose receptor regulating Gpa2-domain-containing protein [Aspergillus pseudonomiae]|uniref:G protein-coupled glucose receptor regulating Gpa2-domain-containing protein n=1 Tax=Aspergillus pseudonomiae TaxID=1506151 RepID=A0A5N7DEL1_9EURO|nr:G protein-coupled glucose receptor regulating Gpa2-domain-containing protein [Aspergillus pseudonomiae]KAB8254446.1 G protein-coupled glucose receptor regulating Gpa2-domain-containing protein [Aspergillus pseudonomiae]KAE8404625.1 G protein-coupled glucose receptor regulating Gpa2-domain-containing protein [Aspergillus pseudonomiae]